MNKEVFMDSAYINGAVSDTEIEWYIQSHYGWVRDSDVTKTPTTFLNGHELPTAYRVKDLFVLIPGLVESITEQKIGVSEKGIVNFTKI